MRMTIEDNNVPGGFSTCAAVNWANAWSSRDEDTPIFAALLGEGAGKDIFRLFTGEVLRTRISTHKTVTLPLNSLPQLFAFWGAVIDKALSPPPPGGATGHRT